MDKITAICASIFGREKSLRTVVERISPQVDSFILILNGYHNIPEWIDQHSNVTAILNSSNRYCHDIVWNFIEDPGYYLIVDDDLFYPRDYIKKMIAAIDRHERRRVVTAHGSNFMCPTISYSDSRVTYGFSDRQKRDIFVEQAGVGCLAFHTDAVRPTLQDFPIPFCRDLYFSLLCAKRGVKIVSLQRPIDWIRPLQVVGETVYDLTQTNDKLRKLKDRVLKEQLLPALCCKDSNEYVLITNYGYDDRLIRASLKSLRRQNPTCNIVIFTDDPESHDYGLDDYLTQYVIPEERNIGRMGSKVLTQYRFACGLPDESKVISADADLIYVANPFEAFNESAFDIGVTTRCEQYHYPLNAGFIALNINAKTKDFLRFLTEQIFDLTWPELMQYRLRFGRTQELDWDIDQDAWCTAWIRSKQLFSDFGVSMKDLTPEYNYCPHADGPSTESGKDKFLQAWKDGAAKVYHLKSKLRELLFDGTINV